MGEIAVKTFDDYRNVNHLVASQWEELVVSHQIPHTTRKIIASSWERCLSNNVNPLRLAADQMLTERRLESRREENKLLLDVATPRMEELFNYFDGTFALVMLSDAEGVTLQGRANSNTWSKVEQINFVPGADWSEAGAGTNAIGTALIDDRPTQIFANEHFCQGWHHLICSAAPIRDPLTKRTLGVIDLTGEKSLVRAHDLYLVVNQAKKIERDIQLRLQEQNGALFEQVLDVVNTPVILFDKKGIVCRCNALGAKLFQRGDSLYSTLNRQLLDTLRSKRTVQTTVCFHKGKRWKVSLYPYDVDHVFWGGFMVLEEEQAFRSLPLAAKHNVRYTFDSIVTNHPRMLAVIEKARKAAKMVQDVLITGESGVGKEVLVQAIHASSPRASGPFIAVNCGALPKELLASELFGHKPGAFTGAHPRGKKGKFVYAHLGTIFLDEIGELPLEAQAYLLRVLEEREVVPLGGSEATPVDVRVIAATNKNLEQEVKQGRFRKDLFYRIHVLHLSIPPLRSRKEDIPLLVDHFLSQRLERTSLSVTPQALRLLEQYHWPGNVRQLRNTLEQAILNDRDGRICMNDLPETIVLAGKNSRSSPMINKSAVTKNVLLTALRQTENNIAQTARLLQTSRTTIYNKMKEYNLKF